MNNQELQELLLLQTNITTIILAFTALILFGVLIDLFIHLYKKIITKQNKKISYQENKQKRLAKTILYRRLEIAYMKKDREQVDDLLDILTIIHKYLEEE